MAPRGNTDREEDLDLVEEAARAATQRIVLRADFRGERVATISKVQRDSIVRDSVSPRMCLPLIPPSVFPPIAVARGEILASGLTVFPEEAGKKAVIQGMIAETTGSEVVERNNTRVFVGNEDRPSTTINQNRIKWIVLEGQLSDLKVSIRTR